MISLFLDINAHISCTWNMLHLENKDAHYTWIWRESQEQHKSSVIIEMLERGLENTDVFLFDFHE